MTPPSPPHRDEGGARADAAGEGGTSGPLSHAEMGVDRADATCDTDRSGLQQRMWARKFLTLDYVEWDFMDQNAQKPCAKLMA